MKRAEVYPQPIVDGQELPSTIVNRLRARIQGVLVSKGEREEAQLERLLRSQPGVGRPNTVATVSPKGGVGKTTSTFLAGNLLATHLKLRTVAVDANPDFGTLAALAPDAVRSDRSLIDLLDDADRIRTAAEVRPYVSRLPTGLHLLGAPADPAAMDKISVERYGELLALLAMFYEVVLLDLGTGITDPLVRSAIQRADQVVVVTTPEWITANAVIGALDLLAHERTTLVLNKARRESTEDRRAIEQRFREQRLHRSITIPYDEQLQVMLDSGTFSLEALPRPTRMPVKLLGVAIAEQLV
jgi:MinD-like ATPase involved in chromosome partitioning or flagellar assembly